MTYSPDDITGVVLAGGRARRMGGNDKGLVRLAGRPMISYVLDGLRPQVGEILVNANRNLPEYAALAGGEVVADLVGDYAGPLAGMASAMQVATRPYVLTAPCDSPFVAPVLAATLHAALVDHDAELSVAHDGERLQPVFALLRRELLGSLLAYLDEGGRKIDTYFASRHMVAGDLSEFPEGFLNVNSPQDRADLESRLGTVA